MSENEQPDEEVSAEQLVAMMSDPEFLSEHGYRMTPKGFMALTLMEHGASHEVAAQLSDLMADRIFLAGFTYLHEDQLNLDFEVVDPDE